MINNLLSKVTRRSLASAVISVALITTVANFEGYREKAYIPIPGDVLTYGSGFTTRPDGSPVKPGDTISKQENAIRLKEELRNYNNSIAKCVKVPVSQNEAEAYTSLSFNIGANAFCKSTLVKKLNSYDYEGACKEILRWDKFKGKPVTGLTNRRKAEYKICTSNQEGDSK